MYHIYFDESKYPKKDFIIGSFVFCKTDPSDFIENALKESGFNPEIEEYKSSTHFGKVPEMAVVREKLKHYFHENCFFGIIILPHSELKEMGAIALNGLQKFLSINNFTQDNHIYFDEGIFFSKHKAVELINNLGLSTNFFHIEQDSKKTKGIQLADLCSHCLTTMLREAIGDLTKMVKNGENSGYDPEDECEIGFEIWASIRYSFLRETDKKYIDDAEQLINYTYNVEPYGLYISEKCNLEITTKGIETFGTVYFGCIH